MRVSTLALLVPVLALSLAACEVTKDLDSVGADAVGPDAISFRPRDVGGTTPSPDTAPADTTTKADGETPSPADAPDAGGACGSDDDCRPLDADLCDGRLVCRAGRCEDDGRPVECPPDDGVCGHLECRPESGECEAAPLAPDGTPCDDGNPCTGGDTCRAGRCVAGAEELCEEPVCTPMPQQARCNWSVGVGLDIAESTDVLTGYSCVAGEFGGREVGYVFTSASRQQVVFGLTANPGTRLFLLDGAEGCRPSACLASTERDLTRIVDAGSRLYLVVDGPGGQSGAVGLEVDCYSQGPEHCANGRDDDWDDLRDCDDPDCAEDPRCIPDVCGDGICHPTGEDCGDCPEDCGECCGDGECADYEDCRDCPEDCGECCGDGVCAEYEDCASCADDCGACPSCGDGACNGDEDCASCADDCGACPLPCVDEDIVCGGSDTQPGMLTSSDRLSGYSGCGGFGDSPERAYRLVAEATRSVTVRLDTPFCTGECDDYDLYVLDGQCDGAACLAGSSSPFSSQESLTFTAEAGRAYVLVVESPGAGEDDFSLSVSCD